jgi:hypothetical protein
VTSHDPAPPTDNRLPGLWLACSLILLAGACLSGGLSGAAPQDSDRQPWASVEKDLVDEVNAARTHPDAYASLLDTWRPFYHGRQIVVPRDGIELVEFTDEGVAGLDEAIEVLRSTHPVPALQIADALCRSARDLVATQGPTGQTGHIAPDGSDPMVRARRYFPKPKLIGEAISYGREGGKDVLRHLLVDDGVRDRGHRRNLLDPRFRFVGAACGPHSGYGVMCVIDLGDSFLDGLR